MPRPPVRSLGSAACLALLSHAGLCLAGADVPGPNATVALIGAEPITFKQMPSNVETDLQESERRYQRKLQQLAIEHRRAQHAILESHVNNFLDSRLLHMEAESRHETVEQLVKEVKNPPVSDADVRAFYDKHQQQFNKPFDAELVPITQYLMQQSIEQGKRIYLAGLRANYAARVTLAPLREAVAADSPSRGPAQARVTLIEFADFQCPYCRRMEPVVRQLLAKYPQDVRLVYRQLPLTSLHPDAMHAAQASLCADAQGRFWEMHDALFRDPPALGTADLKATAARLGLNTGDFDKCLDGGSTEPLITRDTDDALAHGVDGTPGLFINGRFLDGAVPLERLSAVVDEELQSQPMAQAAAGRL